MTSPDKMLAAFLIKFMLDADLAENAVEEMPEELSARIEGGDRKARAAVINRWGTTMTPGRMGDRLRPELKELDDEAMELLPKAVRLLLRRAVVRDQLAAAESRTAGTTSPITPEQIGGKVEDYKGFARVATIMREAKLTDATCGRAAVSVIQQAARLISRSDEPRICDDVVSWGTLRAADIHSLVCKTQGWSRDASPEQLALAWRENEILVEYGQSQAWVTWLPEPVKVDPPQLPRGWVHGAGMEVYPTTWDAFPADPFYASFIRPLSPDERPMFRLNDQVDTALPAWEDVSTFRKNDPDFDGAFPRAENEARIVDGYRARHEERLLTMIAAGEAPHRQRDVELIDWTAGLGGRVIEDTLLWDAWRPWGTLFSALKAYLNDDLWRRAAPFDAGLTSSTAVIWTAKTIFLRSSATIFLIGIRCQSARTFLERYGTWFRGIRYRRSRVKAIVSVPGHVAGR